MKGAQAAFRLPGILRLTQRDCELKKGHLGSSFGSFIQQIPWSNTCTKRGGKLSKVKGGVMVGRLQKRFIFLLFFPTMTKSYFWKLDFLSLLVHLSIFICWSHDIVHNFEERNGWKIYKPDKSSRDVSLVVLGSPPWVRGRPTCAVPLTHAHLSCVSVSVCGPAPAGIRSCICDWWGAAGFIEGNEGTGAAQKEVCSPFAAVLWEKARELIHQLTHSTAVWRLRISGWGWPVSQALGPWGIAVWQHNAVDCHLTII